MSEIPPTFSHILAAWNESDVTKIRAHLDQALAVDVVFVDPNYDIKGVDAFETMIRDFRLRFPQSRCIRTSGIDMHHNRARYAWTAVLDAERAVHGLDVVELDREMRICRVDGFFDPLSPA